MSGEHKSYNYDQQNFGGSQSNDEWYDQGFDLQNDVTDTNNSLDHSINFDVLGTAQQQLESTSNNITVSDASVTLAADNPPKLNIDQTHKLSNTNPMYSPRTDAIIVGGETGRINVIPSGFDGIASRGATMRQKFASYESDIDSSQSKLNFNNIQEFSGTGSLDTSNQIESDTNSDSDSFDDSAYHQSIAPETKRNSLQELSKRRLDRINNSIARQSNRQPYQLATNPYSNSPIQGNSNQGHINMANGASGQTYNYYQKTPAQGNDVSQQAGVTDSQNNSAPSEKPNSEKSLEELARENQGLPTEELLKLKRSSNRCHLVSRTPIFDANSNVSMYELKFTAGKVFQVNALKNEHVYHVLFGYFIRRGLSCFIGRGKLVLVMMPITYDFLKYIDRFSVNRVILRISPSQEVSPSALHLLTKLHRSGMSFAIDLMLLLKKDWNRAILSIEYVMIDLSTKVQDQLNVFNRLKIKAPWLKTIGYNDTNGDGYVYLMRNKIDFYDGPFWNKEIKFNQDPELFVPMQNTMIGYIKELFKDKPNYNNFYNFLRSNEGQARDLAVFFYRFRHASPRQIQNIEDLFQYLITFHPNRSFSVIFSRSMLLNYCKAAPISAQSVLQQYYVQALVRGYFIEYLNRVFDNNPYIEKYGFQSGMFSLLHLFLLKDEVDVLVDPELDDITNVIYGSSELLGDMIDCVKSLENTNLAEIFAFIRKYQIPPASVIISYEKAIMRTNELLLVLHIVSQHKSD